LAYPHSPPTSESDDQNNRLRSFSNSLLRHSLLTIYRTNILPIFDYGSIIYDNCSDSGKHLLYKAQLSAAKIILGCLKTTSSSDVLLDLNLKTLNHHREISILRYFSKIIFSLVPCPLPVNLFRLFSEFVPYTLRRNLDVRIPLYKKSLAFGFFLRKTCSLWNSLPIEIKSSPSHPNFINRLKSYYHVAKQNTFHLLGVNPRLTSVCCMLRLAHSPLNINKKSYRTCVCCDIETEIHLFFTVNFMMPHERSFPIGSVCNIVTDNKPPEIFDCLSD